jgi:hypothetical protein
MSKKPAPRAGKGRPASAAPAKSAAPKPASAPAARGGRLTKATAAMVDAHTQIASVRPKPKPKTRRDKKGLVLYVDPAVTVALRRLSLDTGASVQDLGMIALNLLFREHGQPTFDLDGRAPTPAGSGRG